MHISAPKGRWANACVCMAANLSVTPSLSDGSLNFQYLQHRYERR